MATLIYCYLFTLFISVSIENVLKSHQEFDFVAIFDSFQYQIDYLKADKQDMELNIAMLVEERGLVSNKFKTLEKKIEACESRMSKMAIQVAENAEELSAITHRLDEQDQTLLEITGNISQLKKSLVSPLKIKIIEGRLNKLESLQSSSEQDIKNTIEYFELTFSNLTHHMDYLNNQTLDLEKKIETFSTNGSPPLRQTTKVSYVWLNKSQNIDDISLQELLSSAKELPGQQVEYESVEKDLEWIQMELSSLKLKQWALQSQMLQCNCTSGTGSPNSTSSWNNSSFTPKGVYLLI
ncbi:hypothetical protein LOTGIDRAFT_174865 [Lottia gigantea]|uniref:Uncharacterized protein n=1 Tax=Lottia gigantea TaxID=225164 RepID=V3ZXW1_LOTGI|nr:hypothetical protein LOTGIDRAFT_174865 [Lottia gigantea]ESO96343.1 hypothetical protein LOTGIDRAFT_174865 [Lottia gigantea]